MDDAAYDLIAQYTKTNELMQVRSYGTKEEKVDMCRAITELINRGRMEGHAEGMKFGMEQGMKSGIEQGIKSGMEQGMKSGMEQGMKSGIEQGMKSGIEQGESRVIELLQTLMDADRIEDVSRAISDPEYRRQLYREIARVSS